MDRIDPVIEEVAERLRELEPGAIAVVVVGSYARGTAEEGSDLDMKAITAGHANVPYRMWFQARPDAKPLHVSAGAMSVDRWLSKRAEPAGWTFGFAARQIARYVWALDEALTLLGTDPTYAIPAGEPELEDFIEFVGKVQRCRERGDGIGARHFAQSAGLLAPRLLMSLNDDVVVHDRREALEAALSLRVAPENYREDLLTCLGLVEADDLRVSNTALRLGRGLLTFLRVHGPDVDPQPDIARYLADSTLERHLGFVD
jgi:hypothetical protein